MGKLETPEWIREGYDSKADWEKAHGMKGKKPNPNGHKVKVCPNCKSTQIKIVLGQEEGRKSEWECLKCKWKGREPEEKIVSEEEFLKLGE